ncbi:hypothetical protein KKF11_01570 [Patescibacteria group bacterium]|nr:hypothetical protein [Patescibacteria group bacterium]
MKKKILILGIFLGLSFLFLKNSFVFAQGDFIGNITPPPVFGKYAATAEIGSQAGGLMILLNNVLRLVIVLAGLFAFFNILIAGFGFLGASGDPKKVEAAWAKIWQSMLGLLIILGSFVLAAIFGWLLFGDATAIMSPKLYGPGPGP